MYKLTCNSDSYMAMLHDGCDVITEEDAHPFPDYGMKVGCLIDILANPIIILYQREVSIYCPIFL